MMKKILIFLALLAFSAVSPMMAAEPKTMETDWIWNMKFSSITSATSGTVDPCGFGSVGYSSVTKNCIGNSYSIYSVGANSEFTISHTTRTFSQAGSVSGFNNSVPGGWYGTVASLSTTTLTTALNGVPLNGEFRELTTNPVWHFSGLNVNATTYIWIEYGKQK